MNTSARELRSAVSSPIGQGGKPTLEQQHALAKALFPARYAEAQRMTGKQRNRRLASLRRHAVFETLIAPLRAAGRSCATCAAYAKVPLSDKRCCDDESSGGAYMITTADNLCTDWRARGAGLSAPESRDASQVPGPTT